MLPGDKSAMEDSCYLSSHPRGSDMAKIPTPMVAVASEVCEQRSGVATEHKQDVGRRLMSLAA